MLLEIKRYRIWYFVVSDFHSREDRAANIESLFFRREANATNWWWPCIAMLWNLNGLEASFMYLDTSDNERPV